MPRQAPIPPPPRTPYRHRRAASSLLTVSEHSSHVSSSRRRRRNGAAAVRRPKRSNKNASNNRNNNKSGTAAAAGAATPAAGTATTTTTTALRSSSPGWEDVDEGGSDIHKKKKTTPSSSSASIRSGKSSTGSTSAASRRFKALRWSPVNSLNTLANALPKLSRLLETLDPPPVTPSSSSANTTPSRSSRQLPGSFSQSSLSLYKSPSSLDEIERAHRRMLRQKHGSLHRRIERLSAPSTTSVVSTMTHSTDTSSGSNSTITQRSYDHSSKGRDRPTSRRRSYQHPYIGDVPEEEEERQTSTRPNVFSYLRKDRSSSSVNMSGAARSNTRRGSSSTTSLSASGAAAPESVAEESAYSHPHYTTKETEHDRQSLHSDSGISVRDSSPDRSTRSRSRKSKGSSKNSVPEDHEVHDTSLVRGPRPVAIPVANYSTYPPPHGYATTAPPPMYPPAPEPPPAVDTIPSAHAAITGQNERLRNRFQEVTHQTRVPSERLIGGYEQLARHLSDPPATKPHSTDSDSGDYEATLSHAPLYRKFSYLNHRILLHLQDELGELEDQLRVIDHGIARMSLPSHTDDADDLHPASRRHEARDGNLWHARRTELLGRIWNKTSQYNQVLHSFAQLDDSKLLRPAAAEDVERYEAWLEEYEPVVAHERQFLTERHDLVSLQGATQASSPQPAPTTAVPPNTRHGLTLSELEVSPNALILLLIVLAQAACTMPLGGLVTLLAVIGGVVAVLVKRPAMLREAT